MSNSNIGRVKNPQQNLEFHFQTDRWAEALKSTLTALFVAKGKIDKAG